MPRIRRRINVSFPLPADRYEPGEHRVFRDDLERQMLELAAIAEEEAVGLDIHEFVDDDATPSVIAGTLFTETYANATNVTFFDEGTSGQEITILFTTALFTVVDGANLHLAGGVNFTGSADDVLRLIFDGTSWFEISRSVN